MQSQIVLGCFLLVLAVAYGSENNADVQKVVKRFGTKLAQAPVDGSVHERPESEDGSPCKFNFECVSGCCLIGSDRRRRCSAKATFQHRCNIGQIKGGAYDEFCPCNLGDSVCVQSRRAGDYHCSA